MEGDDAISNAAFLVFEAQSLVTALSARGCFEPISSVALHADADFEQSLLCLLEPSH